MGRGGVRYGGMRREDAGWGGMRRDETETRWGGMRRIGIQRLRWAAMWWGGMDVRCSTNFGPGAATRLHLPGFR